MSGREDFEPQYSTMLRAVGRECSSLARILTRAEGNRAIRLKALSTTGRQLRSLDEILTYTAELERWFLSEPKVSRIAFLLHRAHGDFATAIESFLSGFHKTVLDSMRDVMEIEFLFRDFAIDSCHIGEWLTASEKTRNDKFRPAVLRQRHAASKGQTAPNMPEAADYKGHSGLVHVVPYENPIVWATPGEALDALGSLVCLYDIFEHADRLFVVVGSLCRSLDLPFPHAEEFLKTAPSVREECERLWDLVEPML